MKKAKSVIKVLAFLVVFALLFNSATRILCSTGDYRNYQLIRGLYAEEDNSLDAVYIGSSNTYAFWNPLIGWKEYGIKVYPFTCSSQSIYSAKYMVEEARKTQPDALYIFNTNTLRNDFTEAQLHYMLDYMPFSLNKLRLTKHMTDLAGFEDTLEFYFPIIRFHTRWSDLQTEDFEYELNGLKGASNYFRHLNWSKDMSEDYKTYTGTTPLDEVTQECLIDFLEYCKKENVNLLCITVPQVRDETTIGKYNSISELVESYGFPTVSVMNDPQMASIDLKKDLYDKSHTNIHGSIKYTYFLSEYLIENYGFKDKRGEPGNESWDEGFETYVTEYSSHMLELELNAETRDFSFPEPQNLNADYSDGKTDISWDSVEEADGYEIYRQISRKPWERIGETDGTEFEDTDLSEGKVYFYTVVPYYIENNQRIYGDFSYLGYQVDT